VLAVASGVLYNIYFPTSLPFPLFNKLFIYDYIFYLEYFLKKGEGEGSREVYN